MEEPPKIRAMSKPVGTSNQEKGGRSIRKCKSNNLKEGIQPVLHVKIDEGVHYCA
jgi:hypothetical protein